jgi:hypothetical protein
MFRLLGTVVVALSLAAPALANEFSSIRAKDEFVSLVNGKALTRLGISLNVTPAGQIVGRAFGQPVTGAWRWSNGYFCRDLFFGERDLGPNCQLVQKRGDTVRFIADEGRGDYADLRLK